MPRSPQGRSSYERVHPRSEEELCELVRRARREHLQIRVRGSLHSVPGAIHTDAHLSGGGPPGIEIVLDRCVGTSFDDARRRVTVQSGCRFGADPHDPSKRSTVEAGLCHQLDWRGWALPNLGGVSHMTVAGFLATGAAGGSVRHTLHDSVVAIRVVDGTGAVRELSREDDPERFHAAVVSMGLFGIVSSVTFQCVPRFDVIGSESVSTLARCPVDLFEDGPRGLATYLRQTPYARLLWWPQRGVDKVVIWQARPMTSDDYVDETGPEWSLKRKPYQAFEPVLGSDVPLQAAAGAALTLLGASSAMLERNGPSRAKAALINAFVPEDSAPRRFWDTWWQGLPMDDGVDERWLPTTFMEIWLPLSRAAEAMGRLRDLYAREPLTAGNFAVEIYAAGASPFWMSPSYGEAALRLNFFWFENNPGDPRADLFPRLWELLVDLGARLHWGKLLPLDARRAAPQLAAHYPRREEFLRLREEFDPDDLFLTSYWRSFLGLEGGCARPAAPLPHGRTADAARMPSARWPMLFSLAPADASLVDRADHVIDVRAYLPAPPHEAHRVLSGLEDNPAWVVGFVRVDWLSEPGVADDALVDETFRFMTLRVRVVENVPGRRWVATVLESSLPLGTRMVQVVELSRAPDGGTDLRWRIAYDLPRALQPANRLVMPLFRAMFTRSVENLARFLGRTAPSRLRAAAATHLFQGAQP